MYIINDLRLNSHRRHTYIYRLAAYICMLSVKTVFRLHKNNIIYIYVLNTKTNVYMEIKLP